VIELQKVLTYLTDLENNNNREWYLTHKGQRQAAMDEFEALIQELIIRIGENDNSILFNQPKELTFKLVRDTRFSSDKSPYNPTFRAHISSRGKLPIPVGYFISIKPQDRTFLGGGLFADLFTGATTMIRDYISENSKEFMDIVNDKAFLQNFSVMGTKLKNVPKGYDKDNPMAEYLKNKSWYLEYPVNDNIVSDSHSFIELAVQKFKLMMPFNSYLNMALKNFKMPERK